MPKRKRSETESLDYIKKKIKKLERKLLNSKRRSTSDSESSVELRAEQSVETDLIGDLLLDDEPRPSTSTSHPEPSQNAEVIQPTEENLGEEGPADPETQLDELTLEILGENPSMRPVKCSDQAVVGLIGLAL
ncbi:jg14411 [Pararge aegeria aegeria]|uniref:Jg14411 protein n=1 Tax=Pararge aegeria aegeria TaxID=348720 RepID=A0A8S4RWE5_9NEOP|nr:jg14411 [Pararge aegeria aegeria]